MFILTFLISLCLHPLIKLKNNINIDGKLILKDSDVAILESKLNPWYEIFKNQKNIGFVKFEDAEVLNKGLLKKAKTYIYSCPALECRANNYEEEEKTYDVYLLQNLPSVHVSYSGIKFWLDPKNIIIDPTSTAVLKKVPIEDIVKIKSGKIYTSPYFDKTMYFSANLGLYMSYNGKDWYTNISLDKKDYKISITKEGWVLLDNLYSKDFGINFSELFPKYAYPFKDAVVKSIISSPEGKTDIYLTFSSASNISEMVLFVLDTKKIDEGWKRVYPNQDGKLISVKVQDSFSSILSFINNSFINSQKNNNLDIEDLTISSENDIWIASLLLRDSKINKKKILNLKLRYNLETGWQIIEQIWKKI